MKRPNGDFINCWLCWIKPLVNHLVIKPLVINRRSWYTRLPMTLTKPSFNLRTMLLIAGAALLGAAWAFFNLYRAGGTGFSGATASLIWAVFATPFFTFWGWLLAGRGEGWLAAFVCFCIYFFGIFLGARIEGLIVGADAAAASGHSLYFQLTPAIQLFACVVVALQRAGSRGTMESTTDL